MENISEKECEEEIIRVRVEQEGCSHERGTDTDYEEVFFPGHGISPVRSEESGEHSSRDCGEWLFPSEC